MRPLTLPPQQEYQIDLTHFKPGGPILLNQGAESVRHVCMEYLLFDDMAAELGGLTCALNHRFFGDSFPAGVSGANATTEDFAPLTFRNVILDTVEFVKWIKDTVPGAKDSPVIINGGSYGGTLAATARLWYPEVFYAAWASAPLLRSFGYNMDQNEDKFAWWDWITNVYQDASFEASALISQAMFELHDCLVPGADCKALASSMNLCDAGPSNATEWTVLYEAMLQAYWFATQFSYSRESLWPVPFVLDRIINATLSLSNTNSGNVLHIVGSLRNWELDHTQCLDWRSGNLTGAATSNAGIEVRPWAYILCNYLPGWTSSIRENSMFPSQYTNGYVQACTHPEWQTPLFNYTNDQIIEEYGYTAENIENVGRILFTQGGFDPGSSVGPPALALSGYRNASRTVLMPSIAHTEEEFSYAISPVGLSIWNDRLRALVFEQVKAWIAQAGQDA